MSAGRLLFAAVTTTYILLAIRFEERDLVARLGQDYARYARDVPALVPGRWKPGGHRPPARTLVR